MVHGGDNEHRRDPPPPVARLDLNLLVRWAFDGCASDGLDGGEGVHTVHAVDGHVVVVELEQLRVLNQNRFVGNGNT